MNTFLTKLGLQLVLQQSPQISAEKRVELIITIPGEKKAVAN